MFQTKKPLFLTVLCLLLLVSGFSCGYALVNVFDYAFSFRFFRLTAETVCHVLCFAAALFYIFKGYTKDAAKYFKTFLASFTLLCFLVVVNACMLETPSLTTVFTQMLAFTFLIVLVVAKNLGKIKSFIYGAIILALHLFYLIFALVQYFNPDSILPKITLWYAIPNAVLAGLLLVFVAAKYRDKAARGSVDPEE